MNNKISFFKKLSIFREYRKILKLNKTELEQIFSARIDKAWRIYNVINVPAEQIGEPYNLRKSDIDKIAEASIKEYTTDVSRYLNSKGLSEMYDFYEVKKVDKYAYLIILGFSLPNNIFRSNIYYDNLKLKILPASILIVSIIILSFLFL